jgi:predicted enzyme related to lactoylglutathione lyase
VANRWTSVTVDCTDPGRLAQFWSALLQRPVSDEHDGPGWATVGSRLDAQPRLTFQAVAEPKSAKVRLHLDVQVDDIDAGREQVRALGGRWTGERYDYDEGVVLVMQDPEGHEFCLVQYYD